MRTIQLTISFTFNTTHVRASMPEEEGKKRLRHASARQQALTLKQLAQSESESPSDDCGSDGTALGGLKEILRRSLAGTLGAAAVEGAVGLLMSQKPLLGRWALGRACSLLLAGSV